MTYGISTILFRTEWDSFQESCFFSHTKPGWEMVLGSWTLCARTGLFCGKKGPGSQSMSQTALPWVPSNSKPVCEVAPWPLGQPNSLIVGRGQLWSCHSPSAKFLQREQNAVSHDFTCWYSSKYLMKGSCVHISCTRSLLNPNDGCLCLLSQIMWPEGLSSPGTYLDKKAQMMFFKIW